MYSEFVGSCGRLMYRAGTPCSRPEVTPDIQNPFQSPSAMTQLSGAAVCFFSALEERKIISFRIVS